MKHIDPIVRWGGLVAVVGLVCAMSPNASHHGATKPFRETFKEYFLNPVTPGSFQQQLFVDARAQYGTEVWAGVNAPVSHSNDGGHGSGLLLEAVFPRDPEHPEAGIIAYIMKYEVAADGNQFVVQGYFIPQADGSYIVNLEFVPELGTGRFAGATGTIDHGEVLPGGVALFEGTITTVGKTKK